MTTETRTRLTRQTEQIDQTDPGKQSTPPVAPARSGRTARAARRQIARQIASYPATRSAFVMPASILPSEDAARR